MNFDTLDHQQQVNINRSRKSASLQDTATSELIEYGSISSETLRKASDAKFDTSRLVRIATREASRFRTGSSLNPYPTSSLQGN